MIEKALKMYGHQDPTLHFQCGIANVNLGYLLAAEQMFQKAIGIHIAMPPNSEDQDPNKLPLLAYTQLGHVQRQQDKLDQAVLSYNKVLELDPSQAEIAGLLGKLYYLLGNNTMALEYIGFAIQIATEDILKSSPEMIADLHLQKLKVYEALNM